MHSKMYWIGNYNKPHVWFDINLSKQNGQFCLQSFGLLPSILRSVEFYHLFFFTKEIHSYNQPKLMIRISSTGVTNSMSFTLIPSHSTRDKTRFLTRRRLPYQLHIQLLLRLPYQLHIQLLLRLPYQLHIQLLLRLPHQLHIQLLLRLPYQLHIQLLLRLPYQLHIQLLLYQLLTQN
jgi:hypothetical protein